MQQHGPGELLSVVVADAHLHGDEIGVGTDPLGVTSGQALMATQQGDQLDCFGGGRCRIGAETIGGEAVDALLESADRSGLQGDGES